MLLPEAPLSATLSLTRAVHMDITGIDVSNLPHFAIDVNITRRRKGRDVSRLFGHISSTLCQTGGSKHGHILTTWTTSTSQSRQLHLT